VDHKWTTSGPQVTTSDHKWTTSDHKLQTTNDDNLQTIVRRRVRNFVDDQGKNRKTKFASLETRRVKKTASAGFFFFFNGAGGVVAEVVVADVEKSRRRGARSGRDSVAASARRDEEDEEEEAEMPRCCHAEVLRWHGGLFVCVFLFVCLFVCLCVFVCLFVCLLWFPAKVRSETKAVQRKTCVTKQTNTKHNK
jgi:hypothetical protein